MFPIVDRRYGSTLLACTAAVTSSAASDSRRINTLTYGIYNTLASFPGRFLRGREKTAWAPQFAHAWDIP